MNCQESGQGLDKHRTVVNKSHTGKKVAKMTLRQKNHGCIKIKQKPVMVGDRTLSPERTPLESGIDK
jgi:hypothetical protein